MKRKKNKLVAIVVMAALILTMVMPMTTEAASKKPAVKTVTLRVGGKKVNSKTITINKGSKAKVAVTVSPSNAKKSVTYKTSNKKIATMSKGTFKGVKNGTAKMTVTVKGKNGKKKTVWFKVKVVTPAKKKTTSTKTTTTTTTKPATPSTPSTPSNPSTPSTPAQPSVSKRTISLASPRTGKVYYDISNTEMKGTLLVLDAYKPNDTKDGEIFIGWYTSSGERIREWDGSKSLMLFARWNSLSDWNPTFVQGNATNLASNEVYDNDGIKTYGEVVENYMKEAWVQCDSCGAKYQFKVKDHRGNVIVVDSYLKAFGHAYVLTKDVKSTHTVSSDWAFLEITSAVDKVLAGGCTQCSDMYACRTQGFDPSASASFNR